MLLVFSLGVSKQGSRGGMMGVTCFHCGRTCLRYRSKVGRAARHFCGQACQIAARSGAGNSNWRGGSHRICQECGQEFDVVPASTRKFCSFKCSTAAKTGAAISKACEHCGTKFLHPAFAKRRFCSQACGNLNRRIYASEQQRGRAKNRRRDAAIRAAGKLSGHHTEQQWADLLKSHGGMCVKCHTAQNITRDHIIPLSKGGGDHIGNIQPLCMTCNIRKANKIDAVGS